MRKIYIITVILLFRELASAQHVIFFSGGYNASFAKPVGFNTVVDNYNASRLWLEKPMVHIDYLGGSFWSLSAVSEIWLLDLSYARRAAVVYAQGDAGSGMMQRDIKFSAHTFNMGLGLNMSKRPPYIGLGYNFDFGTHAIKTRIGTPENVDEQDFVKMEAPLTIGGSVYLQILLTGDKSAGVGLLLRPYYHFDINSVNYTWVNDDLNPSPDPYNPPTIRGKLNHMGLHVALVVKIGS